MIPALLGVNWGDARDWNDRRDRGNDFVSNTSEDPRCPECGEPIGQTATYCMHCSADLTDEQETADTDQDEAWEQGGTTPTQQTDTPVEESGQLLDPDGVVDNTLTVLVGIAGGIVVGLVGTMVLLFVTASPWALLFGLFAWLGATAHLVRRRTVQGAVARTGYAVALVLLTVPVIAFSPAFSVEGGIAGRGESLLALLLVVAIPAGIAAAVGWIASQFVPDQASEGA